MTRTVPSKGVAPGAGYSSRFQYEAWTRIPEANIVAIYDRTESNAREMTAAYGVPRYYSDWREMVDREKPDFADIITPPETHEKMCGFLAGRGVHISGQKPLAPTLDASRYNEVESHWPRFTYGELRIDAMRGHLTMDTESTIRFIRPGEPGHDVAYPRTALNCAGDCVHATQHHFVDCFLSDEEFESNGEDYLNRLRVVEAIYQSAQSRKAVKL